MADEFQLASDDQINSEEESLDEREFDLSEALEAQLADLNELELDREKIGNPDSIGEVVKNVDGNNL